MTNAVADSPAPSSGAADRIREAGKWLVASSAAVGAALIAGSQLSDIGSLPLCSRLTLTCLRLPLAGLGGAAALIGIACIIWQAARLLVPIDVTPTDLIRAWSATERWIGRERFNRAQKKLLKQYPEMIHFHRNPDFVAKKSPVYVVGRVSHWHKRLEDAKNQLEQTNRSVAPRKTQDRTVAVGAPSFWERITGATRIADMTAQTTSGAAAANAEVEEAQRGYDRAVKNLTTMVTVAQHQRLFARFEGLLHWLIAAAAVTALGITLFAWASNPPAPSIRLSGADLTGAILSGASLDGADLSNANLTDANLAGATLDGADLTDVVWRNTICPDGSNSDAQQPVTCLGHLNR